MIPYSLSMYDVMISLSMYVLLDKGVHQLSAKGSSYNIWKMGTLDETDVSMSLFGGGTHVPYSRAIVGSVLTLFNGNVRMDNGVLYECCFYWQDVEDRGL
jgi:hypothetical protein